LQDGFRLEFVKKYKRGTYRPFDGDLYTSAVINDAKRQQQPQQ